MVEDRDRHETYLLELFAFSGLPASVAVEPVEAAFVPLASTVVGASACMSRWSADGCFLSLSGPCPLPSLFVERCCCSAASDVILEPL